MYRFEYIYPDTLSRIKLEKKTKINLNFINNLAYHISLEQKKYRNRTEN